MGIYSSLNDIPEKARNAPCATVGAGSILNFCSLIITQGKMKAQDT